MSEQITTVCITTCDRPESLKKSISGLISNLNKYKRTPRILVVDDSENLDNIQMGRDILDSFSNVYSGKKEYMDRTDRYALSKKISEEKNIDREVTDFALCGDKRSITTVGSVRNTFFVKTRGEKILLIEDDVFLNFRKPISQEGSMFTINNPFSYWFLTDNNGTPDTLKPIDIDLLAEHEKILGSKAGDLLGTNTPDYIKELRVMDSYMGMIGDSPMESHIALFLDPRIYDKYNHDSKPEYDNDRTTDRIIQCPLSEIIYQGNMSISLIMGLDNRELIPVSAPIGRAHDLIFGTIRHRAFTTKVSAYIPITIEHNRPKIENRIINYDIIKEVTKVDKIIASFIGEVKETTNSLENLQNISSHLIEIASNSEFIFEKNVEEKCLSILRSNMYYFDHLISKTHHLPIFWKNDVEKIRNSLLSMNSNLFLNNLTKNSHASVDVKNSIFREWLLLYGKLIGTWNIIIK